MIPDLTRRLTEAAEQMMKGKVKPTLPFDPFAIAQATGEFAEGAGVGDIQLVGR